MYARAISSSLPTSPTALGPCPPSTIPSPLDKTLAFLAPISLQELTEYDMNIRHMFSKGDTFGYLVHLK